MTRQLTWLELAKLPEGTRVRFAEPLDIFPECIVPAGTVGTIAENGLNEIWCAMLVSVDDEKVTAALQQEWKGKVYLPPYGTHLDPGCDDAESDEAWNSESPLALQEDPRE
jgi:hypothetical protein